MTSRRTLTAALALTLSLGAAAPALAAVPASTTSTATASTTTASEADMAALSQQLQERLAATHLPALLGGSDATCTATPLAQWRADQLAGWSNNERAFANTVELLVRAEALLFQPEGPQHFGGDGEYTQEIDKTFRTLQSFWGIDSRDIRPVGMHSSVLADDARMMRVLGAAGYTPMQRPGVLAQIRTMLQQNPKFEGGNHPFFTMTAFAYRDPGTGPGTVDKVIIGDGLLEGMEAIGLSDVAPRGILAHEYSHHVQYDLGLMGPINTSPDATRLLELEADGLAAYYLSHPRGERLRQQRVEAFAESFGQTGDCGVTNNNHHGTPNQRVAAARWGDALANAKGPKGHIRTAEDVSDRFRVALPEILAPDAR